MDNWVYSKDIKLRWSFQAKKNDYDKSGCIVNCYEDTPGGTFKDWNGSPCTNLNKIPSTTSIDKGHMIAARYGFGHGQTLGVDGTFTYTNAVPQIGSFNRGSWKEAEESVIELAERCHHEAETINRILRRKTQARVYVVVGVIPTSFFGKPRFFGSGGTDKNIRFSNFQNDEYRLLLPEIMWTAVCCTHIYSGTTIPILRKAFYGNNSETNHQVEYYISASGMFQAMKTKWSTLKFPTITVFPGVPDCN